MQAVSRQCIPSTSGSQTMYRLVLIMYLRPFFVSPKRKPTDNSGIGNIFLSLPPYPSRLIMMQINEPEKPKHWKHPNLTFDWPTNFLKNGIGVLFKNAVFL